MATYGELAGSIWTVAEAPIPGMQAQIAQLQLQVNALPAAVALTQLQQQISALQAAVTRSLTYRPVPGGRL